MSELISLDTSTEASAAPLISMDTGQEAPVNLPMDITARRAAKASFGLKTDKTPGEMQRVFSNGGERAIRDQAAAQKDEEVNKARNDAIYNYAVSKGGPLTTDEINQVLSKVSRDQEFTHPRSIIESEFSSKYFGALKSDVQPGSWYSDVLAAAPQEEEHASNLGKDYTTKREVLLTQRENAQAAADQQSWGGYFADRAKELASLGLYGEAKQRGIVDDTSFFSGLLGTNKEQQRISLFRMPVDKFTTAVTTIADKLTKDNPAMAVEFIDAMLGNSDKDMENLGSLLTLGTAPGLGTAIKVGARTTGALGKATADMVKGTESTQAMKVSSNVAAGNIKEAGIQKATAETVSDLAGVSNPAKQAVEGLPDILKTAAEAAAANPGRGPGAQETTNRIVAAMQNTQTNILNMISNFQRGSRIPAPLATENSVRLMADAHIADYRGIDSRMVDAKGPFKDTLTNTLHWEAQIGKYDGSLFGSAEHAAAAARLEGISLKGEADMARQLQLQKTIAQVTYDLSTARAAQSLSKKGGDTASELRAKLGITSATKTPEFDVNVKALETKLASSQAELDALRKLPGATIEQQGSKFYISKFDPLQETGKVARSLLLSTSESKPPSGFYTSFLAHWRTGEETTSADNMALAKQAIYGTNNLLALAKAELEPYRKLNKWTLPGTGRKERALRVNDTLKAGRTEGLFKSNGQLEDYYLRHYNVLPTAQESEAYFSAVRYGQLQDVLTSANIYTDEARLGAKMHTIKVLDKDGSPTSSGFFKGIRRPELPKDQEGILVMGDKLGDERIVKGLKSKQLIEDVKQGRKSVIEVLYPNDNPLKNFGSTIGENHVKYVITSSSEEAPLQMTKVDRNGGGLWDLDYQHYIKQAKIVDDAASKTKRYKGDTTVMPFQNGALGRNIVDLLEKVRGHLASKDEAAAQQAAKNLPIEYSELKSWFEPKTTPEGKTLPPKLDVNEPFRLVPGNKQIVNMDTALKDRFGKVFRDDTRGNLIHQNLLKSGEHDNYELYTIKDEGSRNNPLYKYEPAQYLDPIPSMNRAMKRIVDSTYMDDYKLFAVEHWVQQAKGSLNATPEALANSPMYSFYHGEYKPGTAIDVQKRLDDAKYKAQQIWGTPSSIETQLNSVAQRMSDSVYSTFGPKMLDPSWTLSKLTDGASAVKSMTYHAAIGLFAWPQFLVQNMTWATIAGIEGPIKAGQGAMAALFHQYSRINPHSVDTLDKFASKLGWKPGEFKEAYTLGQNSGFFHVGSDHALIDNPLSVKVVSSGKDQILDAGSIFFREGERNVRYGAWYTAYRKWRDLNPTGAIADKDIREILNRADLLSGNMSLASKSALQQGPLSFTTQFLGYNLRMAELMTGKRLTVGEKSRLFATYWGLFGVSAAGLSGLPLGDVLRKTFMDNGYTAEPGAFSTFFNEGVPAAFGQLATGKLYGVGQRFGSVGFDPIREALSGDKSFWELAAGAPGSFLHSMVKQTDGLRSGLLSIADTDETTHFPLKPTDLDQALKLASSYNSVSRWANALHTANWVTKRGDPLDTNVSPLNATIMTALGVQEQKDYNVQSFFELAKARKDDQAKTEKAFEREIVNWVQAVKDKDFEQAKDYGIRAKAILAANGYPSNQISTLMARAEKNATQSITDRSAFDYYLGRNVPDAKKQQSQETYTNIRKQGITP